MTVEKRSHHHGDLRAALISAGVDLIREGGPDALSIRKVAARAGVSHAAPAYHFPSLADLRTAVVAQGYRDFTVAMETEIARSEGTPRGTLLAAGRGYLKFAQENPGLFHLMFGGSKRDHANEELSEAAEDAYAVLRRVCAPLKPGKAGEKGNELLVWSIVHGLASLALAERGPVTSEGDVCELYQAIFPDLPFRDGKQD